MSYLRSVLQALVAVLAAVIPALTDAPMDQAAVFNVIALAAGALMVWNSPATQDWAFAKTIASAVAAGAVVISSAVSDGMSVPEWIQVGVAVLGALGVLGADVKARRALR